MTPTQADRIERMCNRTMRLTDKFNLDHAPVDGIDHMPNYSIAHLLAYVIIDSDSNSPLYDMGFGGAGGEGEYLISILDRLIFLGILKVDLDKLEEVIG